MDTIWIQYIENPSRSEVIGRCGGDEKNRMTTQNRQKSNAKNDICKFIIKKQQLFTFINTSKPYMYTSHKTILIIIELMI